MQRLIIFRHGKAEGRAPSGEDFDRRLTARGEEDSRLTAKALKAAGLMPDLALVSAAERTRGTWAAAEPLWPDARMEVRRTLYDAPAQALYEAAQTPLGQTIVVVAHNPGCQVLAISLFDEARAAAEGRRAREGFVTASAAAFEFEGTTVRSLGLFFPRDYGGGSEG